MSFFMSHQGCGRGWADCKLAWLRTYARSCFPHQFWSYLNLLLWRAVVKSEVYDDELFSTPLHVDPAMIGFLFSQGWKLRTRGFFLSHGQIISTENKTVPINLGVSMWNLGKEDNSRCIPVDDTCLRMCHEELLGVYECHTWEQSIPYQSSIYVLAQCYFLLSKLSVFDASDW